MRSPESGTWLPGMLDALALGTAAVQIASCTEPVGGLRVISTTSWLPSSRGLILSDATQMQMTVQLPSWALFEGAVFAIGSCAESDPNLLATLYYHADEMVRIPAAHEN